MEEEQQQNATTERNTPEKLPESPEQQAGVELTLNDVKNIDELVDLHYKGKTVIFPSWIEETKNEKLTIIPQELFIYIIEHYHILSVKLGNSKGIVLYLYNDKGYYELWTESQTKAFIKSFLPRKIRTPRDWEIVYKELITEATNTEETDLNSNEDIINFRNGVLQLSTNKLLTHSPEYYSTIQIPCNYVENASLSQAPVMSKFLNDITMENEEDKSTLLEFTGLAISNVAGPRFKKLLILKGKR